MPGLSRRRFLANGAAVILAGFAPGSAFGQSPDRRRLHALIVGINTYTGRTGRKTGSTGWVYRPIKSLRGCVNDARAIELAVRPLAASTRVLLEKEVTRAAFLRAWQAMVAEASPGDTLLLTYAGHGSQENGPVAAHAPTGLRSAFVLSGFDASSPELSAERILDDEMQGLWRSVEGRNQVVFVADACHSGGMTRSVDMRANDQVTYRSFESYDISSEMSQGVAFPRSPTSLEVPHVVFLSGSEQHEVVPEIVVDGRPHGALSYSFARALSGRADENRDGIISGSELSRYVLRSIRALSDSSQHPSVRWPNADVRFGMRPEVSLFFLGSNTRPIPEVAAPKVRVAVRGLSQARVEQVGAGLQQAVIVRPTEAVDLIWDAPSGDVIDQLGVVLAKGIKEGDLQSVVDRTTTVAILRKLAANSGIDMRLSPLDGPLEAAPSRATDRIYKRGEKVRVLAQGLKHANFLLFNIGGDGTVQLLEHGANLHPGAKVTSDIQAGSPFGGDHLVVVNAARPLGDWLALLNRIDGKRNCRAISDALAADADVPDILFGVQGVFTAES